MDDQQPETLEVEESMLVQTAQGAARALTLRSAMPSTLYFCGSAGARAGGCGGGSER
jgi:hypothetical protein